MNLLKWTYLATVCLVATHPLASLGLPKDTEVTTDGLSPHGVTFQSVTYNEYSAVQVEVSKDHKPARFGGCDNCTFAIIEDLEFSEGNIEVDVAGKPVDGAPSWAKGFIGIVFNIDNEVSKYQGIYLRPENAISNDEQLRKHTVQYFASPDFPWMRLRKEFPEKYETWANVEPGKWTRMRVVVEGTSAALYIDDAAEPVFIVNDLKLDPKNGGRIGLYTEPETDAYFKNLRINHRH